MAPRRKRPVVQTNSLQQSGELGAGEIDDEQVAPGGTEEAMALAAEDMSALQPDTATPANAQEKKRKRPSTTKDPNAIKKHKPPKRPYKQLPSLVLQQRTLHAMQKHHNLSEQCQKWGKRCELFHSEKLKRDAEGVIEYKPQVRLVAEELSTVVSVLPVSG